MFAYLLQVYNYIQSDLADKFYVTIPNSGDDIIMAFAYQNKSDNQKWFLDTLSATETAIVSKRGALDGGAMTVGTQIKVTPFNKSDPKPSQKWKIVNKYLQMKNGLVMEVQGGGKSEGTPVILNNKKSKPDNKNQQFSLIVSSFLSMLQSF